MAFQVDKDGLCKKALQSLINQREKDPKLSKDAHIYLVINTNKRMGTKNNFIPVIIPLRHSKLYKPSELRILLIVKDPSSFFRNILKSYDSTSDLFTDIIGVKKLRTKYKGARLNALFKNFDMVVADYRVHHLLAHLLGSKFYKSNKKVIFMVQMSRHVQQKKVEECDPKYVKAQIKSICCNTWYLANPDNCLTVRIGVVNMHSVEEMVHNINDVVDFLCDKNKRPQGGCIRGGIRSLFIKTSNSVSLPVYEAPLVMEKKLDDEITL